MAKSNFKYSSGAAGGSLFKPSEKDTSYRPFDKQAASQPILQAIENNTKVAVGNLKRTGDQFINTKKIEQDNDLWTAKYNSGIAGINTAIKMDKLKSFSKGAAQIAETGIQIYKTEQLKKGYGIAAKMALQNPDELRQWFAHREKFRKEDGKYKEASFVEGWKANVNQNDPELANQFIYASGWVRQAINSSLMGQRKMGLPQLLQEELKSNPASLNEIRDLLTPTAKMHFDQQVVIAPELMAQQRTLPELMAYISGPQFKDKPTGGWLTEAQKIYRTRARGALVEGLLLDGYDNQTILEEFEPIINLASDKAALDIHSASKDEFEFKGRRIKAKQIISIFDNNALSGISGNTSQQVDELTNNEKGYYPGANDAERLFEAQKDRLNQILKQWRDGEKSINPISVEDFLSGPLKRGKGSAPLRTIWAKALAATNFESEFERIKLEKHGFKKATLENKQKAFFLALAETVRTNGPPTTAQVKMMAESGAAKSFGSAKDLALKINQKMSTQLNRSIEEWVPVIQKAYTVNGELDKGDYIRRGVPKEIFEDSRVKDMFSDEPKYVIKSAQRRKLEEKFGIAYKDLVDKETQIKGLKVHQIWAGRNMFYKFWPEAYKDAKEKYKGSKHTQEDVIDFAADTVMAKLGDKKNLVGLLEKPNPLEGRTQLRSEMHEIRKGTPTGSPHEAVIPHLEQELNYIEKVFEPKQRAAGYKGDIMERISDGQMFPNPAEGGRSVELFSQKLKDIAHFWNVSPHELIREQLIARKNIEIKDPSPLPTAKTIYHKSSYETPEWVTEGFSNLIKNFEPRQKQPERRSALGNTVQEKDKKGRWRPVYKDNGKPLIMDPSKLNKPFNEQDPRYFFTEALGVDPEKFEARLNEMGTTTADYFGTFLKQHGIKGAYLLDPIKHAQMLKILYNYFGDEIWPEGTFTRPEEEEPWMPITLPTIFDYYPNRNRGVA